MTDNSSCFKTQNHQFIPKNINKIIPKLSQVSIYNLLENSKLKGSKISSNVLAAKCVKNEIFHSTKKEMEDFIRKIGNEKIQFEKKEKLIYVKYNIN